MHNLHFYMKINGKETKIYKSKQLNQQIIFLSIKFINLKELLPEKNKDNHITKNYPEIQTA